MVRPTSALLGDNMCRRATHLGLGVGGTLGVVPVERVLLAEPRGFCAGVEMAIKALSWMVRVFEPPVYCYHEIVHNRLVVDRFKALGVVFVDDVAEVPEGAPLMLSAHGSAPDVVAKAREQNRFVVDAVCPLVTKVHHEARTRASWCTFVTSGQTALTTTRSFAWAAATISGAEPWAESMSGAPAGTSSMSSTNTTPRSSNRSTMSRLWTISW